MSVSKKTNEEKLTEKPFRLLLYSVDHAAEFSGNASSLLRSLDGRKEQDGLHMGGITKGLGTNSHLHSPKSNSKRQVRIKKTHSPASGKKTVQTQKLFEKK